MQPTQTNLLKLMFADEQFSLQQIRKTLTPYPKYFFNPRRNILIMYDKSTLYIVHKESIKVVDLGTPYIITALAYNYEKSVGTFFLHFIHTKMQTIIRKQAKKVHIFDWVYTSDLGFNFFIAEDTAIRLYRLDQDKRTIKEIKNLSCKYYCYLYQPLGQMLIGFPYGDCRTVHTLIFQSSRASRWFKGPQIAIQFGYDQQLMMRAQRNKCLGFQGTKMNKQIFLKFTCQDYYIDVLKMHNSTYLLLYCSAQGKLKLHNLSSKQQTALQIKLPSDAIPAFNVVDNMLVTHLRNEKITFIYDIGYSNPQMLVSPYPLQHEQLPNQAQLYSLQFVGRRAISPSGSISKWSIKLSTIYYYLKNEVLVFDFLNRRANSKMQILRWLKLNLLTLKQINISRIWKSLFNKSLQEEYDEADTVSMLQLYTNVFYAKSLQPLVSGEELAFSMLECIRQGTEYKIQIPVLMQRLLVSLLLENNKHDLLAYLFYHEVFTSQQEFVEEIFAKGGPVLQMLAIDLANKACPHHLVLTLLTKAQQTREAKRYVKNYYQHIEVGHLLQVANHIRNQSKQKEYIAFVRGFIIGKYPMINQVYIKEAENQIYQRQKDQK